MMIQKVGMWYSFLPEEQKELQDKLEMKVD